MDAQDANAWFVSAVALLWIASAYTWFQLYAMRRRNGAFLPYEPRTPVPWGAPIALLTALYVAATLASQFGAEPAVKPADELNPSEVIQRLIGFIVFQSLLTTGVLVVVVLASRAKPQDFGLPTSTREFFRDVKIGAAAWLAAIVPAHGIQVVVLVLLGRLEEPPSHPLVEMITSAGPKVSLFLLAAFVAVVVAPVSEEIFFRLLFQGWIEKWEDRRVRIATDGTPDDGTIQAWDTTLEASTEPLITNRPADRGILGLPHGWFPILVSSLLFAAAHIGNGPDPIAIFFLALILGYVYQRTHRILPCIVAHMLFNSLAILVLWQMIFLDAK
jgi:membrane protease YdiL (CAAX protease family)